MCASSRMGRPRVAMRLCTRIVWSWALKVSVSLRLAIIGSQAAHYAHRCGRPNRSDPSAGADLGPVVVDGARLERGAVSGGEDTVRLAPNGRGEAGLELLCPVLSQHDDERRRAAEAARRLIGSPAVRPQVRVRCQPVHSRDVTLSLHLCWT